MALNKVEICGVNTAKLPLLKQEEKDALWERISQGDKEARELYIKGNLRLVLSVIKRFSASSENVDDLFQIGCVGLIKAIDKLKKSISIPASIKEYGVDEKTFLDGLDRLSELAFDDQCTGANPAYPLISEIKQMYLDAYYGKLA